MTRRALLALGLLCSLGASSAYAALPEGYQVVVLGSSIDAHALPPILALPTGAASTIGLGIEMQLVPHGADDWLLHDTTAKTTRVVRPDAFHPMTITASYYEPASRRTVSAQVIHGPPGGPSLSLASGTTDSMANLLQPAGSLVLFQVPEPGVLHGLVAGLPLLVVLARRRHH